MATPKLRFKDFGEDWTAKKLSQVANLTSSKRVHLSDYVSEGIPFFRGKEITELKSGIFPKDILYISKKQYEDFKEKFGAPQNNEILMTAVGTLANTYLINTDFEFYFKDGNLIWFKDINADPNFLMILLDARKNDVLASAIGSTQKALTIANLNKLIFNFPSNEEQTKIASFLSAVDEKINQLTQKHELLSQYKQGMMQKLFSQQLRFKADDGNEFREWSNKTIGDVANIKRGASPRPINDSKWFDDSSSIGWVRISDVSKSKKYLLQTEQYLSTLGIQKSRLVPKGNLIMSICATIGKPIYTGFDVCIHDGFVVFSELQAIHEYAYYYLEYIEKNWYQYGQAGTQVNLNSDIVSNEAFPFPCLEEQTKIANFLSAIDQKIDVVSEQLEQAKLWKKGLLQQMFV